MHAQPLLGHSDVRLRSRVYTHVAIEGQRGAVEGVAVSVTQRILGHSDPKLTARVYVHLGVEEMRWVGGAGASRPSSGNCCEPTRDGLDSARESVLPSRTCMRGTSQPLRNARALTWSLV